MDAFDATSFAVRTKRAIYTYEDGGTETVTDPGRTIVVGADASTPASSSSAPVTSCSRRPREARLGTRWVVLAAVAGLVVGGILAARKKRNAAAK